MPLAPIEQFLREHPIVDRLYAESGASRLKGTRPDFEHALYRACGQRSESGSGFSSPRDVDSFLLSLHL